MKLTIESTGDSLMIDGAPHRLWQGQDERGTPVHVYVRAVSPQTHDPARLEAFDRELKALPPLRPVAVDHRFLAD